MSFSPEDIFRRPVEKLPEGSLSLVFSELVFHLKDREKSERALMVITGFQGTDSPLIRILPKLRSALVLAVSVAVVFSTVGDYR
jgi:hypothetical protein